MQPNGPYATLVLSAVRPGPPTHLYTRRQETPLKGTGPERQAKLAPSSQMKDVGVT